MKCLFIALHSFSVWLLCVLCAGNVIYLCVADGGDASSSTPILDWNEFRLSSFIGCDRTNGQTVIDAKSRKKEGEKPEHNVSRANEKKERQIGGIFCWTGVYIMK